MQYHMEAASEVSNECVQYGTASVSCIVDKMEKATVPWTPILHSEQTFFLFIVISDVNKNLEVGILCFRLQRLSLWSKEGFSDRCELK